MTSRKQRERAERNDEIVRLAKLGLSTKDIARQVRASVSIVRQVRQEAAVSAKTEPLTEEQLAKAEHLLRDGASRNEVARTLMCTVHQLRSAFPGLAWDREQQRQAEHDTGLRAAFDQLPGHGARPLQKNVDL